MKTDFIFLLIGFAAIGFVCHLIELLMGVM
jgi:hypothetical protein